MSPQTTRGNVLFATIVAFVGTLIVVEAFVQLEVDKLCKPCGAEVTRCLV